MQKRFMLLLSGNTQLQTLVTFYVNYEISLDVCVLNYR